MDAVFGNVDELFANLVPDPDQPSDLKLDWMVAPLTEGSVESGVWTSNVGSWSEDDYGVDEVMVMVDGRLRITNSDGSMKELTAGDMFYLPKGWSGRWDVIEPMKKIYFIIGESPAS